MAIEERDSVLAELQHSQAALETASREKDAIIEQQRAQVVGLGNQLQQLMTEHAKDDAEQPPRKKAKTEARAKAEHKKDIVMGQATWETYRPLTRQALELID